MWEELLETAKDLQKEYLKYPSRKEPLDQINSLAQSVYQRASQAADTSSMIEILDLFQWYFRRIKNPQAVIEVRKEQQFLMASWGYNLLTLRENRKQRLQIPRQRLEQLCWMLPDSTHQLSIADLLEKPTSPVFLLPEVALPQIGSPSTYPGAIWLRVRLRNPSFHPIISTFFVGRNRRTWQQIDVFLVSPDSSYTHVQTGSAVPDSLKSLPETESHFQLSFPPNSERTLYLRLSGIDSQYPPQRVTLSHVDYPRALRIFSNRRHINGLFQGVILIQLLFFLLLFYTTKDKDYGYYSIYIGGLTIFTLTLNYYLEFSVTNRLSPLSLYMISIWLAIVGIVKFCQFLSFS